VVSQSKPINSLSGFGANKNAYSSSFSCTITERAENELTDCKYLCLSLLI